MLSIQFQILWHFIPGPSAPPQFVRAVNKTMGSIGVTWNEVPTSDQNSIIVNYTVTYQSVSRDLSVTPLNTVEEKSVISSSRFATLTNLTKNTNYSITVVASNQYGHGPPSSPLFVITSDGSKFFFSLTYIIRIAGEYRWDFAGVCQTILETLPYLD